jgi:hypothetical protein
MTLPRFYQVELLDAQGAPRRIAVDLLDRRTPAEPAALVRSIASTARAIDPAWRVRTAYVDVPAPEVVVQPLFAYAWGDGSSNAPRLQRHLTTLHRAGTLHRYEVRTGSWAEGADLVGREEVLAVLCTSLRAGKRVHLMAPRRYGKTSLVRAIQDRLVSEGRIVVRVDVESVDSVVGLLVRIVDEAFLVTDTLRVIDELSAWPDANASAALRAEACRTFYERSRSSPVPLLVRVCQELASVGAVVLADEFTRFVLLTRQADLGSALSRGLDALTNTFGLGLLVCGSQGLRSFVEWHKLEPLRRLESIAVGPLANDDASVLVEELFYGAGQAPLQNAVGAVLAAVGAPIPYFLHGLVHHTIQEHRGRARKGQGPISGELVAHAYERRLLDQEGNEFFRPFRLKERGYPDALRAAASTILRELARSAALVSLDALKSMSRLDDEGFELLLAALGEDYDVVVEGGEAHLRSKVMRERWARREAWLRGDGE